MTNKLTTPFLGFCDGCNEKHLLSRSAWQTEVYALCEACIACALAERKKRLDNERKAQL